MISYLFFFFLSLGQIGRISFFNQEININLYETGMVVWFFWFFLKFKLVPIERSLKQTKILYIFLSWLFVTYVFSLGRFSSFQNIVGSFYLLRLIAYFVFFIYLSFALTKFKNLKTNHRQSIVLFLIITVLFSVFQYILYPNLRNLSYLGWDPHQYRIFGTFFDTSATAAIFGLVFLYLLFNKGAYIQYKRGLVFIVGYLILGLLTYSRAFYLSILITAVIFLLERKQFKIILPIFLFFLLTLFILPKQVGEGTNLLRTFSVESRLKDQREAFSLALRNPIFGVGYNHIGSEKNIDRRPDKPVSHAGASFHSSFLIILVSSGIIGLLLFILLLVKLASISEIARYFVVFLSTFSFFDNILLYPVVLMLFLSLLSGEVVKNRAVIFHT